MNLLTKHFWKFFTGLLCLLALGYLAIYATDFYAKKQSAGEAKTFGSENPGLAR